MISAELGQDLRGALARSLIFLGIGRWLRSGGLRAGGFGGVELNSADVEILFEAVELKEVGELQCSHIPAALTDFALEIAKDPLEIGLPLEAFVPPPASLA